MVRILSRTAHTRAFSLILGSYGKAHGFSFHGRVAEALTDDREDIRHEKVSSGCAAKHAPAHGLTWWGGGSERR